MSIVQQAIEVSAPLHTVYEQLTAFENYPRFMTGVEAVTPLGNQQAHWVMEVDGERREFDAEITELAFDERVSWSAVGGPLLSETITVRPMGETRTQVVAQMQADAAFLMPSDRHAQETLNRRLKDDLCTFKSLIESGRVRPAQASGTPAGASSKQMSGRSGSLFGTGAKPDPASPASVAARIRNRAHPGAGWGTSAGTPVHNPAMGTDVDPTTAPGRSGTAPMGGRTPAEDGWGDGMINEEDRGSAHDY